MGNPTALNLCDAGHDFHESRLVESRFGPFWIWDWRRYMDFAGYCTGQDEVSKSIDLNGYWELPDTERMLHLLGEERGTVIDLGAHIGWFGVQAARLFCEVVCVDADPENVRLLSENIKLTRGGEVGVMTRWVHDLPTIPDRRIRLLKVDLEGREADAATITRGLWERRLIDHALIEISPIFHDGYPELVDLLRGYGYRALVLKDEGEWEITGADVVFDQENCWFDRL